MSGWKNVSCILVIVALHRSAYGPAAGGSGAVAAHAPSASPAATQPDSVVVEWHDWGPAAFARAQRDGKPIFLSLGYPACYWSSVMEREVFADPDIAHMMNEWFVNIRVDHEERPDIGQVYMTATQLLSGRAGWPNSVFLTPELQPFFAGTFFPLRETYRKPGFGTVLSQVRDAWQLRRAEVIKVASRVAAAVTDLEAGQLAPAMPPDSVLVQRALTLLQGRLESEPGGKETAPRFPPAIWLDFLLADPVRRHDEETLRIVSSTLEDMDQGAIHDHVAGGFFRYAMDSAWRLPRFEKTLYTQALLVPLYWTMHELTGEQRWRRTAERLLHFVAADLTGADGGFRSAVSYHASGADECFLWTAAELRQTLGESYGVFREVYSLVPVQAEGGGILYRKVGVKAAAARLHLEPGVLWQQLDTVLDQLLDSRQRCMTRDDDPRVVAAWHAMMLRACVQSYHVTGLERYLNMALRAAEYTETALLQDNGELVRYRDADRNGGRAFLQDYAHMIRAYVGLYQVSAQEPFLRRAEEMAEVMLTQFWDEDNGGFYVAPEPGHLFVRSRHAMDGMLPAAAAVAVHGLLDLATVTGCEHYTRQAAKALTVSGGMMRATPLDFIHMVSAAERYLRDFPPASDP